MQQQRPNAAKNKINKVNKLKKNIYIYIRKNKTIIETTATRKNKTTTENRKTKGGGGGTSQKARTITKDKE